MFITIAYYKTKKRKNDFNSIFFSFRSTFHSRYEAVTSIFAEILIRIIHIHPDALITLF